MYLHNLHIENFRKFKTLDLEFNKGLNVLIGENDSGKTAIIDALKFILGTHSNDWLKLDKDDFYIYNNTETYEIKIICIFKDLSEAEAAMFLEWLSIDNDQYYLKLSFKAKRKINNNDISEIYYDVKAGEDEESGMIGGEAKNKLKVTYLKPLRDAEYELAPRKGSRLSQILVNHDIFLSEQGTKHPLVKIMTTANEEIQKYFENPDEGKPISDTINETYLKEFSLTNNKLSSKFGITKQELGKILERLELQGISDSGGNLGLGSNNLLFIAAEMLLLKGANYVGLKLSLIEEIEAHLHPQAQINLIDFLSKQSEELGLQSIITTHSNSLASKVDLNNLIICKNGKAFSLRKGETKLNSGDYEFLKRFLDDTKANLFFANGVIVVEGDAENLLIPSFAEFIGYPLHKYGISIVNVGSTALLRYAKIFLRNKTKEELDIPVAVITDLDVKPKKYFEDNKVDIPYYYKVSNENLETIKNQFHLIKDFDFSQIVDKRYTSKNNLEKDFKNLMPKGQKTEIGKALSDILKPQPIDLETELPIILAEVLSRKSFSEQKVKYFISSDWTLEYVLAMSCIRNIFYEAILTAQLILKSDDFDIDEQEYKEAIIGIKQKVEEDIMEWGNAQMSKEDIAYKIFWEIMQGNGKNKTSKAVVAQCLSSILVLSDVSLKSQILNDPYLEYFVNAIKHAANVST